MRPLLPIVLFLLCGLTTTSLHAQHHKNPQATPLAQAADRWVDSVMNKMSLREQVAQLMVVRVPRQMNKKQQREFDKLISSQGVGGVCFFAGTSHEQLHMTRHLQQEARVPLMVSIDAEWGLGMRLTDCYSFPRQMLIGALPEEYDSLVYEMGCAVSEQCRKMGIHVNFVPVVDLNSNPANPVIGTRSFGENRQRVSRKAAMYAAALRHNNILATAKHFPGHGNTETDSHHDLPIIRSSAATMDSLDLYPYRQMMRSGLPGVMIGHMHVEAYDTTSGLPSSLSPVIVTDLLRKRMGFRGLVFTDGLDMKAVTKQYKDGQAELLALRAGADVLLLPPDAKVAIKTIEEAAKCDTALQRIIGDRCRRVLRAKYRYVVLPQRHNKLDVPSREDREHCEKIAYRMATKAITLIENPQALLPLDGEARVMRVTADAMPARVQQGAYDAVVVDLCCSLTPGRNASYGVADTTWTSLARLARCGTPVVLRIFGSPYVLGCNGYNCLLADSAQVAVVMAYQNHPQVRAAADSLLYGTEHFVGLLPVTAGRYPEGYKYKVPKAVAQSDPDALLRAAGLDVAAFRRIDSIALDGIAKKAYPGCQVLVAKDGAVVYNRCYGRLTYDKDAPVVDTNTVYDLASLTKVVATTLAVMRLVDAGKIHLDDHLSRYLPYLKHTSHSKITVKQALSHCARLKAFDAYWREVPLYSAADIDTSEALQVAPDGYVERNAADLVLKQIAASKPNKERGYVYSDLGFILLADMVRYVSGQTVDVFMQQQFYEPLGMTSTAYRPLQHGIDIHRIAPTEELEVYRQCALRGYVHDPNAAAMGGVAGHAGLFSTAADLARLYLMLLNGGEMDGRRYLSEQVLQQFNHRYYVHQGNRRALGYDKPLINDPSKHVSPYASQQSYGHTGFTGTMVWVDPEEDLIYIFLSNRVCPDAKENRLAKLNIRTAIQDEIYKSIEQ